MRSPRRLLEFSFLAMALLGGLLLSLSLGSWHYLLVGGIGTLAALFLVDWTGWFFVPVWAANGLSFVVLYLSMRGFFSTETSGQLGAVANLLVYLQTLLALQEKTTRQYWQLLVLNFLQVVVASVFHMQLEGGLLFLMYMAACAVFLILLNSQHTRAGSPWPVAPAPARNAGWTGPMAADAGNAARIPVAQMLRHVTAWLAACLSFAVVLFVLIPRAESPWVTGRRIVPTAAGGTRRVDLDVRDKVQLDYAPILRATFRRNPDGRGFRLPEEPYFRSMALGSLVIENGNSTWKAPYDRVYNFSWDQVPTNSRFERCLYVEISQEPTPDPLLNTVEPFHLDPNRPVRNRSNPDLSLVARYDDSQGLELLPFTYSFCVAVGDNGHFLPSFPWQHHQSRRSRYSLRDAPAELEWLTWLDRARYPRLVEQAAALASRAPEKTTMAIGREMERWFLQPGRFTYTLDYSGVDRRVGVDSVEDFVANHRHGHCAMFASALAIMLRSQGIPARLAVGFYGGTYNEAARQYMVTGGHAHAWVEAWIPPGECTEEMMESGAAGRGGAWLRLDPTPQSDLRTEAANGNDAINLARSLWQDYVMRLESSRQPSWGEYASAVVAGVLDLSSWSSGIENAAGGIRRRPLLAALLAAGLIVLAAGGGWITLRSPARPDPGAAKGPRVSRVRRLIGSALGFLVPPLGRWVLGEQTTGVTAVFFQRFESLLERFGVRREPAETWREFGRRSVVRLANGPGASAIDDLVTRTVDRFERVHYGQIPLSDGESRAAESDIQRLGALLEAATQPGPGAGLSGAG